MECVSPVRRMAITNAVTVLRWAERSRTVAPGHSVSSAAVASRSCRQGVRRSEAPTAVVLDLERTPTLVRGGFGMARLRRFSSFRVALVSALVFIGLNIGTGFAADVTTPFAGKAVNGGTVTH